MKQVIVPIFVPHMGCPHDCVFCNQYHITGSWQAPDLAAIDEMVAEWTASSGETPSLAFYGGSFTAIDLDVQLPLLAAAAALKAAGKIAAIRLSTRPDALDAEVLARLANYGVDTIEIGVQSLNDDVLCASGRGHTAQDAVAAIRRVKAAGFACGVQLMLALPADTPARSLATAAQVVDLAPDFVRLYPTAVIRDTALADLYASGRYVPWAMDAVLDTAAEMAMAFAAAEIPVIRIGLQAEDQLTQGDVIAGAYHPAMGELVKARIYRKRMAIMLGAGASGPVTFAVAPRRLSQALGHHRENVDYLSALAGVPVKIMGDETLADNEIERR
ncbi:MAG: radical SAM protein [Peptococcaceae bacterium]|nr:radical SAM protein [Peptococcaceae bacterium]